MVDELPDNPFPVLFVRMISEGVIAPCTDTGRYAHHVRRLHIKAHQNLFIERLKVSQPEMQYDEYVQHCTDNAVREFLLSLSEDDRVIIHSDMKAMFRKNWLDGHYLPEITSHAYDVDVVYNYRKFKSIFDSGVEIRNGIVDAETYLFSIQLDIQNLCRDRDWPFQHCIDHGTPIVIKNDDGRYLMHLAKKIMNFDPIKIGAMLDWHKASHQESDQVAFATAVEFAVYQHVRDSSPQVDNTQRLQEIMKWVERNRVYVNAESAAAMTYKTKWNGIMLVKLSKYLHAEKCISKPTDFVRLFESQERLIWVGNFDRLAYLLFRLKKYTFQIPSPDSKAKPKEHLIISVYINGKKCGRFWVVMSQFICDSSLQSHDSRALAERGSRINKNQNKYPDTVKFVNEALSRLK
jgi:hypothetical protein